MKVAIADKTVHRGPRRVEVRQDSLKLHVVKLVKAISGVVSIDEDWILKSKDWPYMWRKKNGPPGRLDWVKF